MAENRTPSRGVLWGLVGLAAGFVGAYLSNAGSDQERVELLRREWMKSAREVEVKDGQIIELTHSLESIVVERDEAIENVQRIGAESAQKTVLIDAAERNTEGRLRDEVGRILDGGPELIYKSHLKDDQCLDVRDFLRSPIRSTNTRQIGANARRVWVNRSYDDGSSDWSRGNALYVTPTLLISAMHVIGSWQDVISKKKDVFIEKDKKSYLVNVVMANRKCDFVLLEGPRNDDFYGVSLAESLPQKGSAASFVGWRGSTEAEGPFQLRYADSGKRLFSTGLGPLLYLEDFDVYDGWSEPGLSGSAVFSAEGQITGVLTNGNDRRVICSQAAYIRSSLERFVSLSEGSRGKR